MSEGLSLALLYHARIRREGTTIRQGLVPSLISRPCSRINQSFGRSAQDHHSALTLGGSGMTTMIVIVFSIALALLLAYFIK
jgi:hypothetical protein